MLQTPPVEAPVSTNLKAVLLLASSLTVMSGATIAAALPLIETHFASQPNAGLYARLLLTVPALLIAVGSPFAGVFVDRFGRKKLLLASLVLYGLAGTSGAFADDLFVLLVGRVLLGIAVAGIMTTSSALVADYFGGKERQQFLGTQAAAMSLGGVLFITLGGWLATFSWREPFYVYLAALAVVPFAYSLVREPVLAKAAAPAPGVKLPGALTGTVLRLYLVIFTGMVMFYLVPVQIPFLLRGLDASPALTGLAIAAATLSGAVASFNFTRIRGRWSTAPIYGVAFLCTGAGFLVIAFAGGYWPGRGGPVRVRPGQRAAHAQHQPGHHGGHPRSGARTGAGRPEHGHFPGSVHFAPAGRAGCRGRGAGGRIRLRRGRDGAAGPCLRAAGQPPAPESSAP
jgi:MFS family permease